MIARYRRGPDWEMIGWGSLLGLIIAAVVILVGWSFYYAFHVSPVTARHKVAETGATNIHIGSRHVWSAEVRCGSGYVAYFSFTATAPNGTAINGRVCKGEPPFQGWSIKYQ